MNCSNCGAVMSDDAKICSKCGAALKKSNLNMIIAIIVIIIAVVAVVGVFASGILDDFSQTPVANNTTDSAAVSSSDSSDSGEVYWASAKSDKFHKPDCEWAQKISSKNKQVYHSRDAALNDGKVPCSVCNP